MPSDASSKKVYDPKLLDKELNEIENELVDIANLYDEVKTHLDAIKLKPFKGSMTFIEKQTSNLINIKNAKLNLIREKINIRKSITDFAFKQENLNKNDTVDNYDYREALDTILEEIHKSQNQENTENEDDVDEELDRLSEDIEVDGIFEDEEASLKSEKNTEISVDDDEILAVDDKERFYKLNSEYEIIEELGHIEHIIKTIKKDDADYAIGESGTIYLSVEFAE